MGDWRRLVREAHRRRVWQVVVVYAAGAWIGMRIIGMLHATLGLHDWVPFGAAVLFLVGLVMVALTAAINRGAPARTDLLPLPKPEPEPRPEFPYDVPYVTSYVTVDRATAGDGPRLSWRRSLSLGVVAFAILGLAATGVMGMRHFGLGPAGTLVARGAVAPGAQIVLADFEAEPGRHDGGAREADRAAAGRAPHPGAIPMAVTEALRLALLDAQIVRVVEPIRIGRALERNGSAGAAGLDLDAAMEVAAAEGAELVVSGTVAPRGAGFTLRARITTPAGAQTLATLREHARDTTDLLNAVDRLARGVRAEIGESLRTVRAAPPLSQIATGRAAAFILFAESLRTRPDDVATATTLVEAAVALDSTFALAWRRLGMLLIAQDVRHAEMRQALTRAYELRAALPLRERLLAEAEHAHLVVHDEARAIPLYEAVLRVAPYDEGALLGLPQALMQQRRFAEAEAPLAVAVQRGIATPGQWAGLVATQYALGRTADARATLEHAQHVLHGEPELRRLEATLAVAEGDWALAESLTRASAARAPAGPGRRALVAFDLWQAARAQGRLDEAVRHLADADAALARLGNRARRLGLRLAEAEMVVLTRLDRPGALRMLRDAEERFPVDSLPVAERPYLAMAEVYAWAGDAERAQSLLDAFEAAGLPPVGDEAPACTRGIIELARGDVIAAVASLRTCASIGACTICGLPALGHALEGAGEPEAALETYERYLATPHLLRRDSDATWRAFVLGRAAELHRQLGHRDGATRRYAEFATLWERADYELQAQVQSARRLARHPARRGE